MKLSIIIPIFNEERTLERLIKAVEGAPLQTPLQMKKEVILIDDGSTDGSREILRQLIHSFNTTTSQVVNPQVGYKAIFLDKNQGKGMAVKRGFEVATGDIVLIQDADTEYNPYEYPNLIRPIVDGKANVVYGSRFIGPKGRNHIIYKHGYLFSRLLNWFSNILSGVQLTDMYTCYKVFSKEVIDKIHPRLISKRFGIDPELTAWVGKFDFRIVEVPISYKGRTYSEGKKINWKDGLAAIFHIIKFNLFTYK